jgi:hypothetical protein
MRCPVPRGLQTCTHAYIHTPNASADQHRTPLHTAHHVTTYNNLVRKTTARFSSVSSCTLSLPSPSVDVVTGHHPISLPLRFHHSRIFLRLLLQFSLFPLPPLYPTWVIHNEQWYTNPSSEERDGRKLHCRWGMVFRRGWDAGRTDPLDSRCSEAWNTKDTANRINN